MNIILIVAQLIQLVDIAVDSRIDDILLKQSIVAIQNEKNIITNVQSIFVKCSLTQSCSNTNSRVRIYDQFSMKIELVVRKKKARNAKTYMRHDFDLFVVKTIAQLCYNVL